MHDLLDAMPHDAAWRRAAAGRSEDEWAALAPWGPAEFLLAHVVDALRSLTYVTLRAHGAKDVRPPEPLPRPTLSSSAQPEPAPQATPEELAAFVRRRKAG